MAKYEVKSVVCDYGLFLNGELLLICNSYRNAILIKDILEIDENHDVLSPRCPTYTIVDFEKFISNLPFN